VGIAGLRKISQLVSDYETRNQKDKRHLKLITLSFIALIVVFTAYQFFPIHSKAPHLIITDEKELPDISVQVNPE